jgi:hypothetical protein
MHTESWIQVDYAFASLSIVGGCFMLMSYAKFKELRTTFGTISMWFGICGIGAAIYPVMGPANEGTFKCIMQSIIGTYFVLASLLASTVLVHTLFRLFYPLDGATGVTAQLMVTPRNIIFVWGTPLVMALIPLITESYGNDDGDM